MSLRYAVRVDAPERHTADIELVFTPARGTVDLTMPAWCPGSYLIRDYARFVRDLTVSSGHVTKIDKQTWRVEGAGAGELTVRYTIYGHDLTVRTNHIDPDHAFLHGPATFLYPVTERTTAVEVQLAYPDDWIVSCAARRDGTTLRADSVD